MQFLLNGLIDGLVLALPALAVTLVHMAARLIALSLGAVYAATPFLAWQLLEHCVPAPLAAALALGGGALLAWWLDLLLHRPLARRACPPHTQVIAALGIYLVAAQALALAFGSDPRVLQSGAGTVYHPGDLLLAHSQLVALVTAGLLLAVFFAWWRRSDTGLRLRALADNPDGLRLLGEDTGRLRGLAFLLAGAGTAAGALLVAGDSGFDTGMGLHALLPALAAMIAGGLHAPGGVLLAALAIGVLRALLAQAGGSGWQDAGTFLLLFALLLWRPQGLLQRRARIEAQP